MTIMADNFLSNINVAEKKTRKRTKAKIRFIEFLRPEGLWPQQYSLDCIIRERKGSTSEV